MNATPDIPAPTISWRRSLLLFLAVLLLAAPQAALLPLLDRDEPRFAEAAREMIESGNYVVPTFNGAPRYDKPPLIYWCQVAAYEIFGQNAFAARLPSLIATAATAVLIFTWGTRIGSEAVGLAAALCYAFCFQTIQQGRVATADALLIFFMTLSAFTGWLIVHPKSGNRVPLPCFIVLALGLAGGFFAKGPEAWLPLVPLLWCAGEKRLGVTLSFVASLLLVLLWGVPAYTETNGAYLLHAWNTGIKERATTTLQNHGGNYFLTLPYYLLLFWISALPWSPLILIRAHKLFTNWKPDLADTYLLFNAGLLFLVFTLMATKLPHYTLPAFPMIALLLVRRWKSAGLSPGMFTELGWIAGVLFALITSIGIPLALRQGLTPSPVGDLVHAASDDLKRDTRFSLVDFREPTAIWEMRRVTKSNIEFKSENEVKTFLDDSGPRAVVLSSELWQKINLPPKTEWKMYEARGLNTAKGKTINLTLIVKP